MCCLSATTLTRKSAILQIAKCGCPAAGRASVTCGKRRYPCRSRDRSRFLRVGPLPQKIVFWCETVTFRASVTPPMGRSESAFGGLLSVGPLTSDSNLVSIVHFVSDFWQFMWNGPLPLNSEGCYRRTVRNIVISFKRLYRVGPKIMCGDFREIRRKYVGKVAKSVF